MVLDSDQRRQYECMLMPIHIQADRHRDANRFICSVVHTGAYRFIHSVVRAHTGIPQAAL